jgi:hypothetical protein
VGLDYELGYGTPSDRATVIMWLNRAATDGRDGLSQQLVTMLRRSDTPRRFRDMDELSAHSSALVGQAYRNSLPTFPPAKTATSATASMLAVELTGRTDRLTDGRPHLSA